MNVLILTPDAVGSTLLQRLITIYMQFHDFDRPVINLHELTNGLEKYFSPEFNREIVSKSRAKWGYHQSLEQVVNLLEGADHYKTSRLAQYHIIKRADHLRDQIPFYQYLDSNFFVISCRRKNLFEHALSLSLTTVSKKLNVFSHREKIETFADLYDNQINLDPTVFLHQLDLYRSYLQWSTDHFTVGSVFYYDDHIQQIENYILDLPIFQQFSKLMTWKEKFNIDFNDWNRCHHIPSDIGLIPQELIRNLLADGINQSATELVSLYQRQSLPSWPVVENVEQYERLPDNIKQQFLKIKDYNIERYLPQEAVEFYKKHEFAYHEVNSVIERMRELDIIVSPPPIKKQSLAEKMHMIKNWQQCLSLYNIWSDKHPDICQPIDEKSLHDQAAHELCFWHHYHSAKRQFTSPQDVVQLKYQ